MLYHHLLSSFPSLLYFFPFPTFRFSLLSTPPSSSLLYFTLHIPPSSLHFLSLLSFFLFFTHLSLLFPSPPPFLSSLTHVPCPPFLSSSASLISLGLYYSLPPSHIHSLYLHPFLPSFLFTLPCISLFSHTLPFPPFIFIPLHHPLLTHNPPSPFLPLFSPSPSVLSFPHFTILYSIFSCSFSFPSSFSILHHPLTPIILCLPLFLPPSLLHFLPFSFLHYCLFSFPPFLSTLLYHPCISHYLLFSSTLFNLSHPLSFPFYSPSSSFYSHDLSLPIFSSTHLF